LTIKRLFSIITINIDKRDDRKKYPYRIFSESLRQVKAGKEAAAKYPRERNTEPDFPGSR